MHLFFIFFIISGFCSLVYQVIWLRIAMADFGVTSTMIAIVLSVFMAGLSAGSWGGGRFISRAGFDRRPGSQLRFYGLLEGLIGLSGVVSAPLLAAGQLFLANNSTTEWGSGLYYLAAGAIVFIVLFPFCVCMGATFPVAMAAVKRAHAESSPTSFSYLYLANLLGAVLGCTGTAFVLIELFGFRGTMLVAVVLNFAVAITAIVTGSRSQKTCQLPEPLVPATDSPSFTYAGGKRFYAVLLLSGLVSMALEIVWTRQFTPFLGPVVYTFATILAIFLAANFAGSRYYRLKRGQALLIDSVQLLGVLLAVAGLAAIFPLVTADFRLPLPIGIAGGAFRVASGVIPFGFILGFVTPWVIDRLSVGEPEKVGVAYAVNTVGCIIGPLLAGFFLLPLCGEKWATFLLAMPFFLIAALLLTRRTGQREDCYLPTSLPRWILLAALSFSVLTVLVTKDYEKKYPDAVVLRDHTATIVAAGEGFDKQLLVNGYGMTTLTPITKLMVHLPLALQAAPPANGLVLCFGMGTSFRSMLSWGIPSTVVELVPSIPRLWNFYHHDAERLLGDPNANVIIDDARRYLYRTSVKFDVIVLDPPPPLEAAASSLLYSIEFYQLVIKRLADGGIFQQWTDTDDPYLRAAIVRSLTAVFPYVRAFNSIDGWGLHLLASNRPIPDKTPEEMALALGPDAIADLVEWGPFDVPAYQFNEIISRELPVAELLQAAPAARAIEDDRPVNEYFLLRRLLR